MNLRFCKAVIVIFIITALIAGCSSKNASEDSAPDDKEKLRMELDKYSAKLEGYELLELELNACDLLERILSKKDSVGLSGQDILREQKRFYLKTGETGAGSGINYRFIDFGSSATENMSMNHLYIQYWGKDGKVSMQKLFENGISSPSANRPESYRFIMSGGTAYAVLISQWMSEERTALELAAFKYEDGTWVSAGDFENIMQPGLSVGELTEDFAERGWLVDHEKGESVGRIAYAFSSMYEDNEYEAEHIDGGVIVYVLKDSKRYGSLKLTLKDARWLAAN